MHKTRLITALAFLTLGGCASAPSNSSTSSSSTTPTANIDYARQSYEGTRFEKAGVAGALQQATFKSDIDSCEAIANRNYQDSIARSAQLSQLYGQALSPQVLAKMKRLQVGVCMAGDKASSSQGKGWTVVGAG
jgi:uncharacterized lipoprotein YmbA